MRKGGASTNDLELAQKLQFAVSSAEEYIGAYGIKGIKEGVFRVLGIGNLEGGRLPLRGKLPDGEWDKWTETMNRMEELEAQYAVKKN